MKHLESIFSNILISSDIGAVTTSNSEVQKQCTNIAANLFSLGLVVCSGFILGVIIWFYIRFTYFRGYNYYGYLQKREIGGLAPTNFWGNQSRYAFQVFSSN